MLNQGNLIAQSVSLPTDRARIHVSQITDPTDATKTLKVLRTDANTPLRGASPWIIDKFALTSSPEISAAFFQEQANENLNSIRLIWFEAWMEGYPIQQNLEPYGNTTDFNNPTEVQHCIDMLEIAVNNASANGMYVCINFHSPYLGPLHLSYAQSFWNVVAPYFKNRTHVLYELGNEPVGSSNSFTVDNDRGTDMSSQVTLYNQMRSAAPNTFILIMTPPSIEGDFTIANQTIQGVQRFESLVPTVDWTRTGIGYHTYYMGWDNSCNCALTTSVPIRAIHRAYPAFPTEVNFPEGILSASYNKCPSLDGEQYQAQTLERLGTGWWQWAVSHPDNSDEGWYTNWHFLKDDAVAKGYFWTKDIPGQPDTQAPTVPTGLISSNIGDNSFILSWTASTDNVGVAAYEVFKNGISAGTTTSTTFSVTGLAAQTTYTMTVKARDGVFNWSSPSAPLSVSTIMPATNLALGKTVTASSQASTKYAAPFAVDGNTKTEWRLTTEANPRIFVDLGTTCTFNRVNILWGQFFGVDFTIQTSTDAVTWTTIATRTAQGPVGVDITGIYGQGRYVRLNITKYNNSRKGVYLAELQVYGYTGLKNAFIPTYNPITDEINEIIIYPNPTLSKLNILNVGLNAEIVICDSNGKLIKRIYAGENDLSIDVSSWNKGLYIINIRNGNNSKASKFVVK